MAKESKLIDIQFLDKPDYHADLIVKVERNYFKQVCDSYYFCIDDDVAESIGIMEYVRNSENSKVKEKVVLQLLLKFWINKIIYLDDGSVSYLPIDISDQYTGCFKIERCGSEIIISYGFTLVCGHVFYPHDPGNYFDDIDNFEENDIFGKLKSTKEELIGNINQLIKEMEV